MANEFNSSLTFPDIIEAKKLIKELLAPSVLIVPEGSKPRILRMLGVYQITLKDYLASTQTD